uniref:Uncharacterized protein n=1 Tax=Nelumbo nucifera TaxID=4432 RepID=A0A822Z2G0_NELNU|nr:TPA_asm: hypothetical protein HUJ06_014927 [Nelumbo nucifera]
MDDELPGSFGTSASLSLRLGQAIFSSASLLFMSLCVEFYNYTAFWYTLLFLLLFFFFFFFFFFMNDYK